MLAVETVLQAVVQTGCWTLLLYQTLSLPILLYHRLE